MSSDFTILDETRTPRDETRPDLLLLRLRQVIREQEAAIRDHFLQRYEAGPAATSHHGYGTTVDLSGLKAPDVVAAPAPDIWQNRAARRAAARASRRASARAK